MNFSIRNYHGQEIQQIFTDLVNIRMTVFSEYPYLYVGSEEFEREIIDSYMECNQCLAVLARDTKTGKVAGIAVGLPLDTRSESLRRPLIEKKLDTSKMFYLAEELIYPEYREQGLGKILNNEIENYARSQKAFDVITLCTIERPENHPRRLVGYQEIDGFWERMGYKKWSDHKTQSLYRDIYDVEETPKPMVFWGKGM